MDFPLFFHQASGVSGLESSRALCRALRIASKKAWVPHRKFGHFHIVPTISNIQYSTSNIWQEPGDGVQQWWTSAHVDSFYSWSVFGDIGFGSPQWLASVCSQPGWETLKCRCRLLEMCSRGRSSNLEVEMGWNGNPTGVKSLKWEAQRYNDSSW